MTRRNLTLTVFSSGSFHLEWPRPGCGKRGTIDEDPGTVYDFGGRMPHIVMRCRDYRSVEQRPARLVHNQEVVGSNPTAAIVATRCKHCGDVILTQTCPVCEETLYTECKECHLELRHGILYPCSSIHLCGNGHEQMDDGDYDVDAFLKAQR